MPRPCVRCGKGNGAPSRGPVPALTVRGGGAVRVRGGGLPHPGGPGLAQERLGTGHGPLQGRHGAAPAPASLLLFPFPSAAAAASERARHGIRERRTSSSGRSAAHTGVVSAPAPYQIGLPAAQRACPRPPRLRAAPRDAAGPRPATRPPRRPRARPRRPATPRPRARPRAVARGRGGGEPWEAAAGPAPRSKSPGRLSGSRPRGGPERGAGPPSPGRLRLRARGAPPARPQPFCCPSAARAVVVCWQMVFVGLGCGAAVRHSGVLSVPALSGIAEVSSRCLRAVGPTHAPYSRPVSLLAHCFAEVRIENAHL